MSGVCGIDYADYVNLGRSVVVDWYSGGNCCPELGIDYLEVLGDVSWASFIDTIAADVFTYGTNTIRVEISPYDFGHGYGDFKLVHFKMSSRYGATVPGITAGVFFDWDVLAYNSNAVSIAPDAAGYAVWDSSQAEVAFGALVMPAPLSADNSCLVDGSGAYKLLEGGYDNYRVYDGGDGFVFDTDQHACMFVDTATGYVYTPVQVGGQNPGDRYCMFTWPSFDLVTEHHMYMAIIGVDASSNDHATIADEIRSIAFRANKFAGFNTGDVNDDNCVDAIDKAYLEAVLNGAPCPIFPYDGNGDVDNDGDVDQADADYLFAYLMGTGPAPQGSWRFTFMP
jgi:hypothetical protein